MHLQASYMPNERWIKYVLSLNTYAIGNGSVGLTTCIQYKNDIHNECKLYQVAMQLYVKLYTYLCIHNICKSISESAALPLISLPKLLAYVGAANGKTGRPGPSNFTASPYIGSNFIIQIIAVNYTDS